MDKENQKKVSIEVNEVGSFNGASPREVVYNKSANMSLKQAIEGSL